MMSSIPPGVVPIGFVLFQNDIGKERMTNGYSGCGLQGLQGWIRNVGGDVMHDGSRLSEG